MKTSVSLTVCDNNTGDELVSSIEMEYAEILVAKLPSEDQLAVEGALTIERTIEKLRDLGILNKYDGLPVAISVNAEAEEYASWIWQGALSHTMVDGQWSVPSIPILNSNYHD